MGRIHASRRDWSALTSLARRRLDAQRALSGDDEPETWEAESFLADALARSGAVEEARTILTRVAGRQAQHFGASHPTAKSTAELLEGLK